MPRLIRHRPAPSRWWSSLLAGAALGGLAACLVLWGRRPPGPAEPDLDALSRRLAESPGTDELRLRSLGQGIVELVGSADADVNVPALLRMLAEQPGVSVVVNRAWIRA